MCRPVWSPHLSKHIVNPSSIYQVSISRLWYVAVITMIHNNNQRHISLSPDFSASFNRTKNIPKQNMLQHHIVNIKSMIGLSFLHKGNHFSSVFLFLVSMKHVGYSTHLMSNQRLNSISLLPKLNMIGIFWPSAMVSSLSWIHYNRIMDKKLHLFIKCGMILLIHSIPQRCNRWSLGLDK